jgi:hypothetical protein
MAGDRTTRTGQPGSDSWRGQSGKDSNGRKETTGRTEIDRTGQLDRATGTRQPRQDNHGSTAGTGHLERTVGADQSGQVSLTDQPQPGQDG